MERKIKVNYQGRLVDGVEMDFTAKEGWNEYELADGTVLRMKAVASNIIKVLDAYDNDGNPVYLVKSSNVLGISAPENLKSGSLKRH